MESEIRGKIFMLNDMKTACKYAAETSSHECVKSFIEGQISAFDIAINLLKTPVTIEEIP